MVSTRRRAIAPTENLAIPTRRSTRLAAGGDVDSAKKTNEEGEMAAEGHEYERTREERIKENLERMSKLGILRLTVQLKNEAKTTTAASPPPPSVTAAARRTPEKSPVSLPMRRSSRLQNVAPISYSEIHVKKDGSSVRNNLVGFEEGQKEEVYTEEHEKLLGNCETSWTLFEDGYGEDGKRIYDHIKGKTCHQCRQKTLGHRTCCSKCNLVQGQFCGDCLYIRYGENVLEVKKNPNWICPVCRGICNCSLCRIKKGWAPTGPLYKKIVKLGFKSVAHYLIQTRRPQLHSGDHNTADQDSSMKSVPFADTEGSSEIQECIEYDSHPKSESCDKTNENNDEYGSQTTDEPAANGITTESTVAKFKSKSRKGRDSGAVREANPDSIASRLRKRPDKS